MLSKQDPQDKEVVADLNFFEKEALRILKGIGGLTISHFLNASWFNSEEHTQALHLLLTQSIPTLNANQAMSLLARLKKTQLHGMACGLALSEVEMFGEDDSYAINTLIAFQPHGLRASHLANKP